MSAQPPFHRVLFICRGSVQDGIGHVIRTRTVARTMKQSAIVRVLAIGDQHAEHLLARQGLAYAVVADDAAAMADAAAFRPDVVVFDLMHFDAGAFAELNARCLTASLSPIFDHLGQVDAVFHRSRRTGQDWPQGPHVYADLRYTVVSEHCQRIPSRLYEYHLQEERLSLAVSMGGTDAANKTLRVLERLRELPQRLLIWALLGEGYAHSYEDLVGAIHASEHEIILAKTNDSMWRILSTCSVALLAGGTTTYEAAYAGLPSINFLETPAHYFLLEELVDEGISLCAGQTFDEALEQLNPMLAGLYDNRQTLLEMHHRAHSMMDADGAKRIVAALLQMQDRRLKTKTEETQS